MATRKKWTKQENPSAGILRSRDKRKWQIAFRRYVLEGQSSTFYAPYFGLDIASLRKWFEYQFKDFGWEDFGDSWQFDHIIPIAYFDFDNKEELKLAWNFTNIRVEPCKRNRERGSRLDVLGAKNYFQEIYDNTGYKMCVKLLEKIDRIELSEIVSTKPQQAFILEHLDYLTLLEDYDSFEFDLLNNGRTIEDVRREIAFLKKFE